MSETLENTGIFIGTVIFFVVLMILHTWYKLNDWSWEALKTYFTKTEGGEATIEEWQAKVYEIRLQFPYPED